MRRLIVNADDFGHSPPVNAGIAECHERGIVTSASLMVCRPAAPAAAEYARAHPRLDLGLHVDLGEWAFDNDAGWVALYEIDEHEIRTAVASQLEHFHDLVGLGPTHLDSHQHVHLREPAKTILLDVAEKMRIPLRALSSSASYCGDFYGRDEQGTPRGDAITVGALVTVLRSLPEGITELCCHPARGHVAGSSYDVEREQELEVLCDPTVRTALGEEAIELISFRELP